MTIKNVMSKAAIVAVSIGLAAASAYAGPPRDNPGREVIPEAIESCIMSGDYNKGYDLSAYPYAPEIRAFACSLLFKSDGKLDTDSNKCKSILRELPGYAHQG